MAAFGKSIENPDSRMGKKMSEINLWDLMPHLWLWRLYAIGIGGGIIAHFWMMAHYGREEAPFLLKILVTASAFVGGYMIFDAIGAEASWTPEPAILASPFLAFLLWIWHKGFHVCEFVDKLLEKKCRGTTNNQLDA
jgi:hypothetical protein